MDTIGKIDYSLNFMLGTMTNREKLKEGLYYSSLEQFDLLMDMELMLKKAKLTEKQRQVVGLFFFQQYTQEETAKALDISQQAVFDHLTRIKIKLRKVLELWGELDVKKFNNK